MLSRLIWISYSIMWCRLLLFIVLYCNSETKLYSIQRDRYLLIAIDDIHSKAEENNKPNLLTGITTEMSEICPLIQTVGFKIHWLYIL